MVPSGALGSSREGGAEDVALLLNHADPIRTGNLCPSDRNARRIEKLAVRPHVGAGEDADADGNGQGDAYVVCLDGARRQLGHDAVCKRERSGGSCIGKNETKISRSEASRDVRRTNRALHAIEELVQDRSRDIGAVLDHQLSQPVYCHDAARERIQMARRLRKLALEALVEVPLVRKRAELRVERRIPKLALCELHVVVGPLDPQHVVDAGQELRVVHRLRQVIVRSGPQALDPGARVSRRRQQNDGNEAVLGDRLDDAAGIDPVEPGHVDVENHEVDWLCAHRVDGLLTAAGCCNDEIPFAKQLSQVLAARTVIVGNDHNRFGRCPSGPHHDKVLDPAEIRERLRPVSLGPGRVYTARQWTPLGFGDWMELKQQLKLSQQLVMTPQLQQAIKLLQMSRMELSELVQEELLENPVLEEGGEARDSASAGPEESATAEVRAHEAKKEEIDWERYLENRSTEAPMPSIRRGSDDEMPGLEATLSTSEDLVDHLGWQLRMGDFVEDERRFAALVIGNLDDNGYLKIEGLAPEEVVPRLAAESDLNPEDAEEVLAMIQQFDPVGVAARSLQECLTIQAKHYGMDDLVLRVISDHLGDLEKRHYPAVAKALGCSLEEVYDVAQIIAELEPRPARRFQTDEPRYIVPDVHVHRVGDEYYVVANDDGMPKLKISGFYRSAMADNPKAKEYIQDKLRSAQWLIRSIDQRRKTIVKVTECIVDKQRDFFDKGIEHLKPMILRDVAETVGMHESTISRVTSNKYVHTPRGTFELKYFFNSAIKRDHQNDIASESVKQAIKNIISGEDPKAPLSDQRIVEILAQDDIKIARRTVAKYREMLGILSSSKRKKYF